MAKLVNTAGVTAVHHGGKPYAPDKDGVFEVPDDAVAALRAHGFATPEEARAAAAAAAAAKKKA